MATQNIDILILGGKWQKYINVLLNDISAPVGLEPWTMWTIGGWCIYYTATSNVPVHLRWLESIGEMLCKHEFTSDLPYNLAQWVISTGVF